MSVLVQTSMTEAEAQKLTERIRVTAHNYAEAREKLQTLVAEAKAGNAHLALGYASWQAYLTDVLGEEPMRLASADRPEWSRTLSNEGLSTRAIGSILGVSKSTVENDLNSTGQNWPVDKPKVSHGLDGKTRLHQSAPASAPKNTAKELGVINDLRLYFGAIERSRQIAKLSPEATQLIIDAATHMIDKLKRNQQA